MTRPSSHEATDTDISVSKEIPHAEDSKTQALEEEDVGQQQAQLSEEHKQFLLERHGTLNLKPLPSMDPEEPLNWPRWRKNAATIMVAVHSMVSTFMAAGIVPCYASFSNSYGVSMHSAAYLTSVQILLFGPIPFLWNPIAARFGRRPVFLASAFFSLVCNIGGANARSYGSQMATRALTAVCISPPIAIGSGVVTELFFTHERPSMIGWWTLLITVGVPIGPFIMGFVVQHASVDWVFWIFVIMNFALFVGYLILPVETLYIRSENSPDGVARTNKNLIPMRIDPKPFTLIDFVKPLSLARYVDVLVPTVAYALTFCYANIVIIVEMPAAIGEKFNLDAQQTGLQFIAVIVGCVLGEQGAKPLSNLFLRQYEKWSGRKRAWDRLWIAYPAYGIVWAGLLTWGFQIDNATDGVWNVTPLIGAGIASFGLQLITTTLVSYAVDSIPKRSPEVGVFVNLFRQVYGFLGPFYFPEMFSSLKFAGTAGVLSALLFVAAMCPVAILHFVRTRQR